MSLAFLLVLAAAHAIVGDSLARLIGIAGVGLWCALQPNDNRRIKVFLCALAVPLMLLVIDGGLVLVNWVCPYKYDLYLYALDHTLGFSPSQLLGHLASSHPVYRVVDVCYELMPTMMVAAYGWVLYSRDSVKRLLWAYVVSGSSPFFYLIVPAAGPVYLFGRAFTSAHPSPQLALVRVGGFPNCIPSVHLSTAILIWYFVRSNKLARRVALGFIFVTAFATLALGQHYLIDLTMSFPFVLFIVSSVSGHYRKAAISMLVVIAWLVAIRMTLTTLLAHPVLLWSAVVLTAAISWAYLPSSAELPAGVSETVAEESAPVSVP